MIELPRLPRVFAREHLERILGSTPEELVEHASTQHPQAAFPEVLCGEPVGEEDLASLRESLIEALAPLGFPGKPREDANREFDVLMAKELYQRLPIAPRTAADPDVWSFMCCVLLPDVARWRFPSSSVPARFTGGVRNTLQRLWIRAAVLSDGDVDPEPFMRVLPEDALVQIFERPAIWADWALGREIATLLAVRLSSPDGSVRFEAFARRVLLEIRQLMPVANLTALPVASRAKLFNMIVDRIDCP